MTHTAKGILRRSIHEFRASDKDVQKEMIQGVREKINTHYTALNTIGMGYAEDYVIAGKTFLKIFDRP